MPIVPIHRSFSVLEPWHGIFRCLGNHVYYLSDNSLQLSHIDMLVEGMGIVIAGGKIDRRHAKFRRNKRYVAERALGRPEAFGCDVFLEIIIAAVIVDGIISALAVKLYQELQVAEVFRQFALGVVFAEDMRPYAANLFIAGEQQPRLSTRLSVYLGQCIDTAAVIAANALGFAVMIAIMNYTERQRSLEQEKNRQLAGAREHARSIIATASQTAELRTKKAVDDAREEIRTMAVGMVEKLVLDSDVDALDQFLNETESEHKNNG